LFWEAKNDRIIKVSEGAIFIMKAKKTLKSARKVTLKHGPKQEKEKSAGAKIRTREKTPAKCEGRSD